MYRRWAKDGCKTYYSTGSSLNREGDEGLEEREKGARGMMSSRRCCEPVGWKEGVVSSASTFQVPAMVPVLGS